MSSPEQFQILRALQDVADALDEAHEDEGSTPAAHKALRERLRAATDRLDRVTTPFAARRMDERVRHALSGRTLEQMAA